MPLTAKIIQGIYRQNISSRSNWIQSERCPCKAACRSEAEGAGRMGKNLRTEAADRLFDAVLTLKSREECYRFFEDICTVNELQALSQRFEVAHMLRNHQTYMDIAETTGASTATISRVNRSLNYGHDGYDLVLRRLRRESEAE